MKHIIIIIMCLVFIPFIVCAKETLTNSELEEITGQAGIDDLESMSLSEIKENWTREDFENLSSEDQEQAHQIIRDKMDALSSEEREEMMQEREQRFQNMTTEERTQMMQTGGRMMNRGSATK